jgi:predicted O-linked N-acetylglucosamine transferase (SPINDLY family)
MDYFLTSDLMEPQDSESHYSEELVKLPNLSLYYLRPGVEKATQDRNRFGLQEKEIVFLCCQYLSKYLPQHDVIFPRIALDVPSARFIFIAHRHDIVTATFQKRLAGAFQRFGLEAQKHCTFFRRLEPKDYFSLNRIADVYLDTIGWSGGNTTFEALACGLPVVLLPGALMRGRHSYAMLKRMEMTDTIASTLDEYVDLAIRLGKDADFRREISEKTSERSDVLFHDEEAVRGLEKFYEGVI